MRKMGSTLLFLLVTLIARSYGQSQPEIQTTLVQLSEETPVGDFAFQIVATDPDGDPLTYKITGENAYHFDVNENTGEVKVKSQLDREEKEVFPINVVVNDGLHADVQKVVNIVLDDANDNRPIFEGVPYNENVKENTPVTSTLFTVSATDLDAGLAGVNGLKYKIDEVIPNNGKSWFSISERGGQVTLMKSLNYTGLSSFYTIKITVSDSGGPFNGTLIYIQSSTTTAIITVIDVPNLNPAFLNLPYTATINEGSLVDTSVFKVQARDPDTGISDEIIYSIEHSTAPDLFKINGADGVISVKTVFDREVNANVTLNVKATEKNPNVNDETAATSTEVEITIGDINDEKPQFYKCDPEACNIMSHFNGYIDEHSSVGVSVGGLDITAWDLDQGTNSNFQLLLEGPDKKAFTVAPSSATSKAQVLILIRDPVAVDYETNRIMTVQVVAKDSSKAGFSSTATVTIQINDLNDNNPKFLKETYDLVVDEHSAVGTIVDTITATDPDTMDVNNVTYSLIPDSILPYFDVDPNNGNIMVKNSTLLDRESRTFYSPTLRAKDSDGNIGTAVLEITLRDINDNRPVINRETYDGFIKEGPGEKLTLNIMANDADEQDTENSKIQYHIVDSDFSNNFTIDVNTGQLENTGPLDREAIDPKKNGVIELNVTASDMGTVSLSTSVKVVVNVDDINDNSPVFRGSNYIFHVKESERGIFVGSVVATDADQTEINNRISFRITEGSFGIFLISSVKDGDGYRGDIRVDPGVELNFEGDRKSYNLTVEAADLGGNMIEVTVQVVVEDVNDEQPSFEQPIKPMSVKENSTLSGPVGMIEGKDPDTNHSLIYELISMQCQMLNGTIGACEEEWFQVESTGAVKTSPDCVIDYEKYHRVIMNVRVTDLLTEKGKNSSDGQFFIDIEDINDNAPEFIPIQEHFVVLAESIEQDSSVARVRARDLDSGENKKIIFKVQSVTFVDTNNNGETMDIFKAQTTQEDPEGNYNAEIISLSTLVSGKKGKYLVTVVANNGVYATITQLEIFTVDETFKVGLSFDSPVAEVNENLDKIRQALTGATKAEVHILKVSETSLNRNGRTETTLLEAYFVFRNGTALNSDQVVAILNREDIYEQYGVILRTYGLTDIVTAPTLGGAENTTEFYLMVGLVGSLIIVLVVTTTSLVCIKRNYKRKLKAAKAMNTAAMVVTDNQKSGPVVPGTNKYNMEGANPVLNLNIDTTTDLGFDEEGSNTDRVSLNSLDYNIDMNMMTEKDTMPMVMIEEEDEENGNEHTIEPLGAALAQRTKKKGSKSPQLSFTNAAMNTTDL